MHREPKRDVAAGLQSDGTDRRARTNPLSGLTVEAVHVLQPGQAAPVIDGQRFIAHASKRCRSGEFEIRRVWLAVLGGAEELVVATIPACPTPAVNEHQHSAWTLVRERSGWGPPLR